MFERFVDRARRVLVLAQEEARLMNHNFIGTEHLLLGLIREGEGVAAKALESLGVSLDTVRGKVDELVGPTGAPTTGSPPFTPRAKHVLELSLREALQLGHNYIGTEHILLAVVREGHGVAAQALVSLGVDLTRVRQQVGQILSGYQPDAGTASATAAPAFEAAPRCGPCGASLTETARYRSINAAPDETEPEHEPLTVTVVYCRRCGVAVGDAPTSVGRGPEGWRAAPGGRQTSVLSRSRSVPAVSFDPVRLDDMADDTLVDLVCRDGNLIEGTVAGDAVRLRLDVPGRRGTITGVFTGDEVTATWRLEQRPTHLEPTGALTGRFADQNINLAGRFRFYPGFLFDRADIHGYLGGQTLQAELTGAGGGLGSTIAVLANGAIGDDAFDLLGALAARTRTVIRGTLGGQPVRLDATTDTNAPTIRILGTYEGPAAMLALIVGAGAYFPWVWPGRPPPDNDG